MKNVILYSLLAGGLLFGSDHVTKSDRMMGDNHVSGRERVALRTSSPSVHVRGKHHAKDRVTTDKTTINAFVPVGK